MTENDRKLLAEVFREAREIVERCENNYRAPSPRTLERALDNFDLRASFQVGA